MEKAKIEVLKNVSVSEDLHKRLAVQRAVRGFKSFNDLIEDLLNFWERKNKSEGKP